MAAITNSSSPVNGSHAAVASSPWKTLLVQHIEHHRQSSLAGFTEFFLATVSPDGQPRVRTLHHRCFWGESIHPSSHNDPRLYESGCPTFITGASSNKGREIYAAGIKNCASLSASGGGGQVEVLYWFPAQRVQWRIRGVCWLIAKQNQAPENERDHQERRSQAQSDLLAKQALYAYMRRTESRNLASTETQSKQAIEAQNLEVEDGHEFSWNDEIDNIALASDVEERRGYERAGFRVGVILPEAVELRDQKTNGKNLWVLVGGQKDKDTRRRVWIVARSWP